MIIDGDSLLVIIDADGFEAEAIDVGSASDGDQQLVDDVIVTFVVRVDLHANATTLGFGKIQFLAAAQQLDAVGLDGVVDDFSRVGIFARRSEDGKAVTRPPDSFIADLQRAEAAISRRFFVD